MANFRYKSLDNRDIKELKQNTAVTPQMSYQPQKQRKRNCLTLQRSLGEGVWNSGPVTLVTFIKGIPGKAAWRLCLSVLRDTGLRGTGLSVGRSSSLPPCSHPQSKHGMGVEFYYTGRGGHSPCGCPSKYLELNPSHHTLPVKEKNESHTPQLCLCKMGQLLCIWNILTMCVLCGSNDIMPFFFLSVGFYCFIISIQKPNWKAEMNFTGYIS